MATPFVCSVGRTLGDDCKWHIWDEKKQIWLNEIPAIKVEVVGINELAEDLSGYKEVKIRKIQPPHYVGSISREDARRAARIVSDESKAKAKKKAKR